MSANIDEIMALFPEPRKASVGFLDLNSHTIRGPCSYETFRWGFSSKLKQVVDAIREDEHWGPVFKGDLSRYDGDHSTADFAMCGELARHGLNARTIDMAIRYSGLYRDKWERDDYRQNTIAKVLPQESEPDNELKPDFLDQEALVELFDAEQAPTVNSVPSPLDLANGKIRISPDEPPPRDWVVDGLLLAEKSAVLAGFGGVSKTQLAIQLAMSVALGQPFADRAVKQGGAILLLGEEDRDEISRRVSAVVRQKKLDQSQITRLVNSMYGFPFVGQDMRLTVKPKEGLKESPLVQGIVNTAKQAGGIKLIVLDHLALLHGGDFNAREDAALTMRVVNHIGQETGAAVLLLAHSPKSAAGKVESDSSMVAGSTAFVDQARGAWILATMREDEAKTFGFDRDERLQHVSLDIVKNNYAATGEVSWFKRESFDKVGLLEHVSLIPQAIGRKATLLLENQIVEMVRARPGGYSKTKFRDTKSGKTDGPLLASKAEVERTLDDLLAQGRLVNRVPSQAECKQYGLDGRVKFVMDGAPDDAEKCENTLNMPSEV